MNISKQYSADLIKTILDYIVSVIFLILLLPVTLLLAIAIRLCGKGKIIFSQRRIGKSGKPFSIYKFRSMYPGTDNGLELISDRNDKRITSLGRFMRKHKLDEIPNFINVLKGEMSIIGPRPEQEYYIGKILQKEPQYKLIQTIKPGITSWGQVKYGYASTVDEMIERLDYELIYLNERSLWFDLKIAFYTIGIIIKGKGI